MCSIDNSDLLQKLWYKFLNSSFKKKSENLLIFLRSLYIKSSKQRNQTRTVFITSDISGIAIMLTKQFLTDLENLYMLKMDSDEKGNELDRLKAYLETEYGALMLYGIEFIIEQILIAKRNNTDSMKSSVLKIIIESELGNILATTLLSILTDMCLNTNQLIDKNFLDSITVPEFTFSQYLRQDFVRSSLFKTNIKQIRRPRPSEELSTDDNEFFPTVKIRTKRRPMKFSKYFARSDGTMNPFPFIVENQSVSEIGELCQSDMDERLYMNPISHTIETSNKVHILTSLRTAARLLYQIIQLDPSMHSDAISIYLEVLKSCCRLLNNVHSDFVSFQQQLLKLADDLLCNIALTVSILVSEKSSSNSIMTIILGHKVTDRLLEIHQLFHEIHQDFMVLHDINKLVFYIFIIVTKNILENYSGSCRGIIHLLTGWYATGGSQIAQISLNSETSNEDFYFTLKNSKISLFSEICVLLSLLKDIPNEKRLNQIPKNSTEVFSHHSDQFNYIVTAENTDSLKDVCCYGSICYLILDNLVFLLNQDSQLKFISSRKKHIYNHILASIKTIRFCCTVDLMEFSNKLVRRLINPMPAAIKTIVISFLQRIIEISFEFYKLRFSCDCQFSSRHDVVGILQMIRNVCIPKSKEPICPLSCYNATFVELLHFIDWLGNIQDDKMKALVKENVIQPIFKRTNQYASNLHSSYCGMIGSSMFSLLPYMNYSWENDDLNLLWSACEKFPKLKRNYYKCLTITLLSTRSSPVEDSKELSMKTRIIDFLVSRVNFEILMKQMDHNSGSIKLLFEDIYIWECFRILFTYNDEFRRTMFTSNGIDCCYVMLKEIIEFISILTDENLETYKLSGFLLFESLMCLVIDGNMLKNIYYYEGYSYEIIWVQIQSSILKYFPKEESVAQSLIQSLLNCCFRHKWTVQNDLYQLRRLFLDSIVSKNISITNQGSEIDISDVGIESSFSEPEDDIGGDEDDSDIVNGSHKYDADVSSDLVNDDESELRARKKHNLRDTEGERANVFIDINTVYTNGSNMEINTDFLRLFIKIILSLPIDNYHFIGQKALESVYYSLRYIPDKNQQSFICDDFMEKMMCSIENILNSHDIPGLQLILLKLLTLPFSCWCTAKRLRFLINLSEKNPGLKVQIIKMLIEKAELINSLQPDLSLMVPVHQNIPKSVRGWRNSNFEFYSFDEEIGDVSNYLFETKLNRPNWKGLDFDNSCENSGFSVSMWIQMDSTVEYKRRKKSGEMKKNKKKSNKLSANANSLSKLLLLQSIQDFIHVTSIYSKDKNSSFKSQCFQIWCKPSTGTIMIRFYQRIYQTVNLDPNKPATPLPQMRESRSQIFNIFQSQTVSRWDSNDSSSLLDTNSRNSSFVLVGESMLNNVLPLNAWNFVTVSVNWKSPEVGEVFCVINGDFSYESKLIRNSQYVYQGSQSLESFFNIGQLGCPPGGSSHLKYNLGSLFIFEGAKIQTANENLSLMFLSPNWDGGSMMLNAAQRDSANTLGLVIMRILADRQVGSEFVASMLERCQNILQNNWLEKMNELITNNLVATFTCGDIPRFEVNEMCSADSEMPTLSPNYYQFSSIVSPKSETEVPVAFSSNCFSKYFIIKASVDSAIENLGGISIMIFWLAKVVESGDEVSTRYLLKLILLLIRKSVFLAHQNIEEKGYSVLLQLFKSFKMTLGFDIISDLVQHMIYEDPTKSKLSLPCNSRLCRDPQILHELLMHWKILATSKLNASKGEISMTESQALNLDKYLLEQINSLLNEDNIYSIINCGSLGQVGLLSPLLMSCQEPFEALEYPLPVGICKILIQIINNLIPTPVDISIVTKLCNTILQLHPISMKDNEIDSGQYYRHLKAFTKMEVEKSTDDHNEIDGTFPEKARVCKINIQRGNHLKLNPECDITEQLSISLMGSKVSEVEKKTLQQFYVATLTDNRQDSNENNEFLDIESSMESSSSEPSSCPTLIDENDKNEMNSSFETSFIASNNLTDQPVISGQSESSRVHVIAGLISILENVIEVKVSDSILERCSNYDFFFEFILHLLSHTSALVRQKSLSLFRVYLYRKKSQLQQNQNQWLSINLVSHVIHQNSTTKEILAEAISIMFGQNLFSIIMDIDWENFSIFNSSSNCSKSAEHNSMNLELKSICKLQGIVSNQSDNIQSFAKSLDETINSSNHFGLQYQKSAILLLSILSNIDNDSMLWAFKICGWLFVNHSTLLQSCLKSGFLEFMCNCPIIFYKASFTKQDPRFTAFLDLCAITSASIIVSNKIQEFSRLLEMCEILHVSALKLSKQLTKTGTINHGTGTLAHYALEKILMTIIESICIINSNDPAFNIPITSSCIQKFLFKYRLLTNQYGFQKNLNEQLSETIKSTIGIVINTEKCFTSYYVDTCEIVGLSILFYSMILISNCLACNQTPDEFSVFLGCKEAIKSHLGDLLICLTQSKLSLHLRLEAVKCVFRFHNFDRVVRYCLLGNSSGSLCLILNVKQILEHVKRSGNQTEEFIKSLSQLLFAISPDFSVEDLNEDNRNLWVKENEFKLNAYKKKFKSKLDNWNQNTDRRFNEVSIQMKNSYNNYRTYARKNLQHEFISNIKAQRASEFYRRLSWKILIATFTQEKEIWDDSNKKSQIYRLDPIEGPSRIRRRMIKTTHKINDKYFNPTSPARNVQDKSSSGESLTFLFESTYQVDKIVYENPIDCQLLKCIEDIQISCPCILVCESGHFKGEFFVGKWRIGFLEDRVNNLYSEYDELPNYLKDFGFINWHLNDIEWVLRRRFKLRDYALEMIMKDGRNCLIAMNSTLERDRILSFIENILPPNANRKPRLIDIQREWAEGKMSNFDYLTFLNTAAGRSYNDIMQYPVFPFILTEYTSSTLDLTKESTYRDLSKPISIQNGPLREKVINCFTEKADEYQRQLRMMQTSNNIDEMSVWAVPPYHYSSLYSNSATVLYYMIRIPPFTQKFIQFQDGEFDRPDRMFHTMASSWHLSTSSLSCMKEIIPEFFYLPELFVNSQDFNFGERLNGTKVDDVILPEWSSGDARLFCLIHRASLESPYVSNQLNYWVDLVFGFKQTGKAALEAINLFHPYTYYKAICPDEITEEIRRSAVEQMIENYGQIPKQLFINKSFPAKKINWRNIKNTAPRNIQHSFSSDKGYQDTDQMKDSIESNCESIKTLSKDRKCLTVLNSVIGIEWGDWVGSPNNSQTFINEIHKKKENIIGNLFLLPTSKMTSKRPLQMLVIQELSSVLMLPPTEEGSQVFIKFSLATNKRRVQVDSMTYGNPSNNEVQLENLGSFLVSVGSGQGVVKSIAVSQRSGRVFFGMESGLITVYQGDMFKYSQTRSFVDNLNHHRKTLLGHKTEIIFLQLCDSFAVLASCDIQTNVAIWDSQTLELLHYIDWQSVKYIQSSKKFNFSSSGNIAELLHNEISQIQSESMTKVSAMSFSETLGDMVISRLMKQKTVNSQYISNVSLFTINGKHVDSIMLSGTVVSLSYTKLTEGCNVNAIATITDEGRLTVMSSWNLQVVWKVKIPQLYQSDPIKAIQYTHSGRELYVLNESGHLQVLQSNRLDLSPRQSIYFWL